MLLIVLLVCLFFRLRRIAAGLVAFVLSNSIVAILNEPVIWYASALSVNSHSFGIECFLSL